MSFNGKPENDPAVSAAAAATAASAQAYHQGQQQTQQQQPNTGAGFASDTLANQLHGTARMRDAWGASTISRNSNPEILTNWTQGAAKVLNMNARDGSVFSDTQVIGFDAQQYGSKYSAVLIGATVKLKDLSPTIVVFTLLLADSGEKPSVHVVTLPNNQTVEQLLTPGDFFTGSYFTNLRRRIAQVAPNLAVVDCGHTVVYGSVDPEKPTNTVFNAVYQAMEAIQERIAALSPHAPTRPAITIAGMNSLGNTYKTSSIFQSTEPALGSDGKPQRNDIMVTLSGTDQQVGTGEERQTIPIVTVSGYIDVLQTSPTQQQSFNQYQPAPTQRFVGHFVQTDIHSYLRTNLNIALLGVAVSSIVAEDLRWQGALRPSYSSSGDIDIRNVGVLGLLTPHLNGRRPDELGDFVDVKSQGTGEANFYQFMFQAFLPNIVHSIDCQEHGNNAFVTGVFTEAVMRGDKNALDYIINSFNELTGTLFSKHLSLALGNQPLTVSHLFELNPHRIPLGTFINPETKVLEDIRKLDFIAVANLTAQNGDFTTLRNYDSTFNRGKYAHPDMPVRERQNIIARLLGPTVNFTGYARRISLTGLLGQVIRSSFKEAGFVLNASGANQNFTSNQLPTMESIASLVQGGLTGMQGASGMFTQYSNNANVPGGQSSPVWRMSAQ